MAHEPVWASGCQTPQGGPDSEPSAQTEEAGEAQTRRERHKHQPNRGPCRIAGHPPEIDHLGIRIGVGYNDGGAGEQRVILYLWREPREAIPEQLKDA